jgi:quinol monooxygenase YgiN
MFSETDAKPSQNVHMTAAAPSRTLTMYGLIVKLTVVPGKREPMIDVLKRSAGNMPGCLSYVVAQDSADDNVLWVTEVWESAASHDASLALPAVKNAVPHGKALVSVFERIAVTSPVWGAGLSSTTASVAN